ncbi:MAG: hypothetical protein JF610_08485 [Acidobacteria bacterium]|nr:hypothetical protein [Acidobacteriota bacterium]MBW8867359.1 hypothetical protein [Acidobacteriota bacterium]
MTVTTFNPRALLVAIPMVMLLWWALDARSTVALAMAVVVYGVLSFAGALSSRR